MVLICISFVHVSILDIWLILSCFVESINDASCQDIELINSFGKFCKSNLILGKNLANPLKQTLIFFNAHFPKQLN